MGNADLDRGSAKGHILSKVYAFHPGTEGTRRLSFAREHSRCNLL